MSAKLTQKNTRRRGFTLVELLISVGLFALLMTLITTTFFYLVHVQRTIDSKQQVLNDFRSTIDVLSKEVTSGSAFPSNCQNGCESIIFTTKTRPDLPLRNIEYRYDDTNKTITKATQTTFGLCATLPFNENCFQPIVGGQVRVESAKFFVNNKEFFMQPIITAKIDGTILPGKNEAQSFAITTSLTPRLLQDPAAVPPGDNIAPSVTITSPVFVAPGDTGNYSTGNPTITLSGTASDNVGMAEMRWRNEATNESGIMSGSLTSWDSPSISLKPAASNTIVISGVDTSGIIGSTVLIVQSTAPAPQADPPTLSVISNGCGRSIWIGQAVYCPANAVWIAYYACQGVCTPTESDYLGWNMACNGDYGSGDLQENTLYSFSAIAFNTADEPSAFSNIIQGTIGAEDPNCDPGGGGGGGGGGGDGGGGGGGGGETLSTDYGMSASPVIMTVRVSGTTTTLRASTPSTIRIIPNGAFSDQVVLSVSAGAPSGTQATFTPVTLTSSNYSTGSRFVLIVPDSTPIGTYTVTVKGTSQTGEIQYTDVILDVAASGGGQQ